MNSLGDKISISIYLLIDFRCLYPEIIILQSNDYLICHAEGQSPEASHRSFGCLSDTLRMTERIIPDILRMTNGI